MKDEIKATEFYEVNANCINCNYHVERLKIEKGKPVEGQDCPNCGNRTLKLEHKPRL